GGTRVSRAMFTRAAPLQAAEGKSRRLARIKTDPTRAGIGPRIGCEGGKETPGTRPGAAESVRCLNKSVTCSYLLTPRVAKILQIGVKPLKHRVKILDGCVDCFLGNAPGGAIIDIAGGRLQQVA